MLSREKMEGLTRMGTVASVISVLSGTPYGKYLKSEDAFQQQLRLYLIHVQQEMLQMVPKHIVPLFDLLINQYWGLQEIERLLALKQAKVSQKSHSSWVFPGSPLKLEFLKEMEEADSIEQLIQHVEKTTYGDWIQAGMAHWKADRLIQHLTEALYDGYYQALKTKVLLLKGSEGQQAQSLIGCMIDAAYLKKLLRLREANAPDALSEGIPKVGLVLYSDLPDFVLQGNVSKILDYLSNHSNESERFAEISQIFKDQKQLSAVEHELDRLLLDKANEAAVTQTFSLGNLLAYFFLKTNEIKQVETLLTGITVNLDDHELKKLLVLQAA